MFVYYVQPIDLKVKVSKDALINENMGMRTLLSIYHVSTRLVSPCASGTLPKLLTRLLQTLKVTPKCSDK